MTEIGEKVRLHDLFHSMNLTLHIVLRPNLLHNRVLFKKVDLFCG